MQRAKKALIFTLGVLSFLTVFCFSPRISYADAPQDVRIGYDPGTQTLSVTITHKSSFPVFHYIKNVEIRKNGSVFSNNSYNSQPEEVPFTYTYKVDAAPGDMLQAIATCSLSGSKMATMTVPKASK